MLRNCMLVGMILLSAQTAFAQKTSEFSFGRQCLFFPETNVAIRRHCPGKTQVPWAVESANRKLLSGTAKVLKDVALVEFKTPAVKDGVMLELKLVVDEKSQPLFLVSRDVFADQRDWLDDLNLILLDDEEGIASEILNDMEISFKTTADENTTGALVLVTRKKFDMTDYHLAIQGNFVVVVAPEEFEMRIPQMTRYQFAGTRTFLLTNDKKMIFADSLKKVMPLRALSDDSSEANMFFLLGNKDDYAILQTIGMNSSGTGWDYAEFRFASNNGRLLFVNTPIFETWGQFPDSQILLKLLFEEMKSQQHNAPNKEK